MSRKMASEHGRKPVSYFWFSLVQLLNHFALVFVVVVVVVVAVDIVLTLQGVE